MSKKDKNRNKFNPPQTPKVNQPVKTNITRELKLEVDELDNKTQNLIIENNIGTLNELSKESDIKLKETQSKEELAKYFNFVKDINKRLETLIEKAEIEKNKSSKYNEEIEKIKKELVQKEQNLEKEIKEYLSKESKLQERETAIEKGQYTTVIKNLLDALKGTKETIFKDTEILIKSLGEFHKENLDEFSKYLKDSSDYEKKSTELNREKKKFEINKEIFEENIREEIENKYSEEIESKKLELNRLQQKFMRIETENSTLKQFKEDLQNAFDTIDDFDAQKAENILKEFQKTKSECEELKNELDLRPTIKDLQTKKEQIELLEKEVEKLKSLKDEKEVLVLKQKLFNQDTYVIEINGFKSKIESFEIREGSLKKTIKDLQETINQLKGETDKKTDAFEFAKKCDADTKILGINHLERVKKEPNNLAELCSYIQQRIANISDNSDKSEKSDKHFYYTIETIRIFLAGLHMSPISILHGISGTGKTSLPREFAKSLIGDSNFQNTKEIIDNAPYRICAIQSGWRDNMDLMGYYNSFEHKYKETDFFKALYLANLPKYKNTLFLIILDEMNLSRPEHYFADFLSLLEQSENERFINLTNTPEEVLPALIKGGKLRIPENVRFIGTANHDETTLEFAPKTYDRSNVMELPKNHPDKSSFTKTEISFNVSYNWLINQFNTSENNYKMECEKFIKFTSELEQLLLVDKNIGVGNRLETQAEKFISVYLHAGNPKEKEKDLAIASDHLISSRLFRTLKNRYDLDKTNLTKFKDDYVGFFKKEFKHEPKIAIELLDNEIKKK